jgi:regulator of sigma E protease
MMPLSLWWYLGAFALALGVLIVVHELGHYTVARMVGVKVLRFSVGFGKPLLTRRWGPDATEWVLAAFPLGGYVKMLDEREGAVSPEELHRAFNRLSVGRRALVVVAGPLANLLLAVFLYWGLFVHGVNELRPILATPTPATIGERAGIRDGELVRSVSGKTIQSMQELRWELMSRIVDNQDVVLELIDPKGDISIRRMDTSDIHTDQIDGDFMRTMGLLPYRPPLKPIVGAVARNSPAESAGIVEGDEVVSIDGQPVRNWSDLAQAIREAAERELHLIVVRGGREAGIRVVPKSTEEAGRKVGRIGIGPRDDPAARARMLVEMRFGLLGGLVRAVDQTWETSLLSVRMIGRMLMGEVSWKNVSGPVTIADYAGQSARLGVDHYVKFLALISISLGVLNLLPIPVLDGGHLLYYLFEVVKGGPLSERVMEIGQQIGMGLLAILMAIAFYNDINRLISG